MKITKYSYVRILRINHKTFEFPVYLYLHGVTWRNERKNLIS